ncbi:MAG: hypothetical protein V3V40_06435 [Nitrosomonadaceae bacterium]
MAELQTACEAPKQDNHVEIFEAVLGMDLISEKLSLLIKRVSVGGVEPISEAQPIPQSPPLQEVLRDCSGDIRGRTQGIIESINELELKLF